MGKQSETYYMITINQHPECEVTLTDLGESLKYYAKKISTRWMLALEEGGENGKEHYHLSLELEKPIRKDNIVRNIYTATRILKHPDPGERKHTVVANGTSKVPHKTNWEIHAIEYVEKDRKYTTNMDEDWIQEQVALKRLKNEVDQKSIYVNKPQFWKIYREELLKSHDIYKTELTKKGFKEEEHIHYMWTKQDPDVVRHEIFSKILKIYTPLWLKHDIIPIIIEYQEGLHMYHEYLEGAVNRNIMFRNDKPLEIEIVGRRV